MDKKFNNAINKTFNNAIKWQIKRQIENASTFIKKKKNKRNNSCYKNFNEFKMWNNFILEKKSYK